MVSLTNSFAKFFNNKTILLEGGAHGHMSHIYEDQNLTFGNLKQMIDGLLSGSIKSQKEKTDGQALAVSVDNNGNIVYARNKGNLRDYGLNGMSSKDVADNFKDRGDITDAFSIAAVELERALLGLNKRERVNLFKPYIKKVDKFEYGNLDDNLPVEELLKALDKNPVSKTTESVRVKPWLNVEIIWPETTNVIHYGKKLIIFHNFIAFDVNGNPRDSDFNDFAERVKNSLESKQLTDQENFKIDTMKLLNYAKDNQVVISFEKTKNRFFTQIDEIKSQFGNLDDNSTLGEYYELLFAQSINNDNKFVPKIDLNSPDGKLLNKILFLRWFNNDKRYVKKRIQDLIKKYSAPHTFEQGADQDNTLLLWFNNIDSSPQAQRWISKGLKSQLKSIIEDVGVTVMKNLNILLAANPDNALQQIKDELKRTISRVRESDNQDWVEEINSYLVSIQRNGGIDEIVPSEGVTFQWENPKTNDVNVYKLTGTFADINQLIGFFKYSRA